MADYAFCSSAYALIFSAQLPISSKFRDDVFRKTAATMAHRSVRDMRTIDTLKKESEWLLSDPTSRKLLTALRRALQSITRNIFIVNSIPEQYEDIYDVLVDGAIVVRIEIPRRGQDGEVIFEKWTIDEYLRSRKNFTKISRRRLQLAIELAHEKAGSV
jgi:hypothetical protein